MAGQARPRRWAAVVAGLVLLLLLLLFLPWIPDEAAAPPESPPSESLPTSSAPPAPPTIERPEPAGRPAAPSAPPIDAEPEVGVAWVKGTLHDAEGRPLAGARVRLSGTPSYRTPPVKKSADGWSTAGVVFEAARGLVPVRVYDRVVAFGGECAVTDENGHFTLPPPPAEGGYDLTIHGPESPLAHDPACIRHRIGGLEHLAGKVVRLGVVRLPRPGSIVGTVVDEDGRPMPHHRVFRVARLGIGRKELSETHDGTVAWLRLTRIPHLALPDAFTDADGRFTLMEVPPGAYVVGAGPVQTAQTVTVAEGKQAGPIRLVVPKELPPLISGRVVDAETGVPIQAEVSAGFRTRRRAGSSSFRPTAPDGSFRFHSLEPAPYTVYARAPGYKQATWGPNEVRDGDLITGLEIRLEHE